MLLPALLLATLVLHQTTGEDVKASTSKVAAEAKHVEAKDIEGGYGYSNNEGYGYHGYGRSYSRGYGGRGDGGYGGYDRSHDGDHHRDQRRGYGGHYHNGHHQEHKLVPIKIPYIDANGCRFPGEPVCNTADDRTMFLRCILANENKNLWKKPTFQVSIPQTCPNLILDDAAEPQPAPGLVPREFCNNNKRLLKAAGLIQEKDNHNNKYFHQGLFTVNLDPCFLAS